MRVPLLGGAYSARSVIANACRSINYFPEVNRKDSPTPFTDYQRPGIKTLAQGVVAPVRGLHQSSQSLAVTVIGQTVYKIEVDWRLTELGQLETARFNPTKMSDNGVTALLVDGSPVGYSIDLATGAMTRVVDPSGTFTGAEFVDYLDGFLLWNVPDTISFGSTLNNVLEFDATYVAGKNTYPDLLRALVVNRQELILFGRDKSEPWYDAGGADFPFAKMPGIYIEHGIVAPYSLATADVSTLWLGQDQQGYGIVFEKRGHDVRRVSNFALDNAISKLVEQGVTITDAIGYTYQQGGHVFYVLIFPTADQTWVYDLSIGSSEYAWHQRAWSDVNGLLHRTRDNCAAVINGKNVVGDWQNGTIYEVVREQWWDEIGGTKYPIQCVRTFPHLEEAIMQGQRVPIDGRQIQINSVELDFETGTSANPDVLNREPGITLRWSKDRGRSWNNWMVKSAGAEGRFETVPKWGPVGGARNFMIEVAHSLAAPAALNGAFLDVTVLDK